jgi:hypothetical protein
MESKKFKYIFGEPTFPGKATFEGIRPPEGTIEGNVICGNDKWIAVSNLCFTNKFFIDALEKFWRRYSSCTSS